MLLPLGLEIYARLCGWTLARAHARSGDRIAFGAYLGKGESFDRPIADLSERYADQHERDYAALADAAKSGRIEAEPTSSDRRQPRGSSLCAALCCARAPGRHRLTSPATKVTRKNWPVSISSTARIWPMSPAGTRLPYPVVVSVV